MTDRPTPADVVAGHVLDRLPLGINRGLAIIASLAANGYRIVDADDVTIAAEAPHSPTTASEPPEGTTGPREPGTDAHVPEEWTRPAYEYREWEKDRSLGWVNPEGDLATPTEDILLTEITLLVLVLQSRTTPEEQ